MMQSLGGLVMSSSQDARSQIIGICLVGYGSALLALNDSSDQYLDLSDKMATLFTDIEENYNRALSALNEIYGLFNVGYNYFALGLEKIAEYIKNLLNIASTIPSPIVLDLNGDGVTTTALTSGTYFDHAGDGFAEQTAWVSPEDGLLVRDLNHNGTIDTGVELFGNNTVLANGQKAVNGFLALADLDTNKDGKIDASDTAFSELQVWKDANGDGITSTGELHSLAGLDIASINPNPNVINPSPRLLTFCSQLSDQQASTGKWR